MGVAPPEPLPRISWLRLTLCSLVLVLLLRTALCMPQSLGVGGDPTLSQQQETGQDMEQAALDMTVNTGQMPSGHGWGKGEGELMGGVSKSQGSRRHGEGGGGGGRMRGRARAQDARMGGGGGVQSPSTARGGGTGGGGAGQGTGAAAGRRRGGGAAKSAKNGKAKEEEKSFSEQTEQALLQFGVLVGVSLLVAGLFFLSAGLEVALDKAQNKFSEMFGRQKPHEIEEVDPAALVGTFKRYK